MMFRGPVILEMHVYSSSVKTVAVKVEILDIHKGIVWYLSQVGVERRYSENFVYYNWTSGYATN